MAAFNGAVAQCDLSPTVEPAQARRGGRYVVENGEHVDVLVARSVTTFDGVAVAFDDVWARRRTVTLASDVDVQLPAVDDLILMKRFADRPRDLEDIRLLRILRSDATS